ncbi:MULTISPECIES: tandem-type lipoprotein [Staphylococcus]|nr:MULTISPECIES: tandem-type lipoprotein [Staphylococcus]ASJ94508.1 tandem-type lipoprotein [Staphylococcus epidermidis]KAB2226486.1 tandem-type lipoprotein [Staphylococcus epidermidis]MBF2136663.1 tandem-type lipoprotein [Staphylococcus epidermidis]MBF2164194.1 tandem-type lipoprotein [Staphylococcus epidermidis]MBF2166230.1 tandem-type lipoprotein [Staphylococcus epidermidis]
MKHSKKLVLFASFLILTIFNGGCGSMTKEDNKEEKIKKSFEKTLGMYPIKNLEDLYDKEGYRDEEFDKDDKGTWTLYSEMAIQRKGDDLETRGMVLKVNRNTRTSKGNYIINKISTDSKGVSQNTQKKYPIKMENNKIIPTERIENFNVKKEIEEFKFFSQYANFNSLKDYKNGKIATNPKVPSYSAEYDLENSDYNVKQLRKRYDIPTQQPPKLLLKGTGDLKGSSIGSKDIEFTFIEKPKENIYFSDSLDYKPSEGH